MEIEMKIQELFVETQRNKFGIILQSADGKETLPMLIGVCEANAIALALGNVQAQRPQTHDLLKNVFADLKAEVQKVVVNDLRDGTFYALVWAKRDTGDVVSIDARPSDAIALALRVGCPVFVESHVLAEAKKPDPTEEEVRKLLENPPEDGPGN